MRGEAGAKERLAGWLARRFFLRFHLSLILGAAFLAGLLTTKLFLLLGLDTLHWRWPMALAAAYLTFLLGVRIWLAYVGLGRYLDDRDSQLEIPDVNFSSSGGGSSGSGVADAVLPTIRTGGGQFGGGGASGDFALAADGGRALPSPSRLPNLDLGDADEGCLVAALILALLAVVFGAGVYMVWQAPALLAEAAFEAALAAGLVKPVRRIDDPGWVGGAVRASWKPFLVIFVCAMAIAGLAEHFAPEATTLLEALRILVN